MSCRLRRDELDPEPIYYTVRGEELTHSHSLNALIDTGVEARLDPLALKYLLALGYLPFDLTLMEGVCKLIPGEEVTLQRDGSLARQVSSVLEGKIESPMDPWNLRYTMEEAVKDSVSGMRVACAALSGGLDTSTVVALSRPYVDELHTFTMGFGLPTDEFEDARIVSDSFDTVHHEIEYDFSQEAERYPELVLAMEEPRPNLYVERVHREAAAYSRHFLCGLGGDELFKGYQNTTRFRLARRLSRLSWIPGGITLASIARNRAVGAKLRQGLKGGSHRLYVTFISPLRYHPDLWEDAYKRMTLIGVDPIGDFEEYCYLAEWRTKMVEDTLVPEYKMARMHNLDIKFPLADRRMVKAAFSTPFKEHKKGDEGKILLKKAMKDLLPGRCLEKPKRGFSFSPFDMYRAAQNLIDDLLTGSEPVHKYFGLDNLAKVKGELEAGRKPYTNARTLILLYAFHFWAERFLQ